MLRNYGCGELNRSHIGQTVKLAGWVHTIRNHGGLLFIDLRDRYGRVQILFREKTVQEAARNLRAEDVVAIEGQVIAREAQWVNPKLSTGEVEVIASKLEVLNQVSFLPFSPSDPQISDEDLRYTYRYLDLRRPEMTEALVLRSNIIREMREYGHRNRFVEVETPILYKSTPEGAREFLVPSRFHAGEFYALPQSPQLFKQLLMISGLDRYMQIARCFRDESLRTDRQLEFTQLDLEMSFVDREDIMTIISGLLKQLWANVLNIQIPDIPRMTYLHAMTTYGVDKPDLRYGLEIQDISEWAVKLVSSPFLKLFQEGVTKAIVAPESVSRKMLDALTDEAKKLGAMGLMWLRLGSEISGPLSKGTTPELITELRQRLNVAGNAVIIAIVSEPQPSCRSDFDGLETCKILGELRQQIAKQLKLIPENSFKFTWVTDFPSFEFDAEKGRYVATHHPFTAPMAEDLELLERAPNRIRAQAYDIVLNGFEIGGGSIRIHNPETQARIFKFLGIGEEEAKKKFGFLLDALKTGAPPHGGIALGVDRLTMLMLGKTSIKDVIAFPKAQSGRDLMTGAPSPVEPHQLQELHIKTKEV